MARSFLTLILLLGMSLIAYANPAVWRGEGWSNTDFTKRLIEWDEIASGGPPKDGIPAIDSPRFRSIDQERSIDANEAVVGLVINGDARAYPIRILMWHEIVNDTVGDVPVVVTYCPLCNSAIVFERRSEPGLLTFGTTGKLRNSDLVMYDRQTESWWQQFTGRSIVGQLAGQKLKMIPSRLESFALFTNRHPDGRVLMPTDASFRDYGRNPYEGYDTSKIPFLYRGKFPEGINPMARVVAIREGGTASAVTLELLRQKREIAIGDVVLSWKAGQASALDKMRVGGGREVGNVIAQRKDGQGRKKDVPYDVTFAFAFYAFHPSSAIIKRCPIAETHSSAPARANLERFDLIRCGPRSTN